MIEEKKEKLQAATDQEYVSREVSGQGFERPVLLDVSHLHVSFGQEDVLVDLSFTLHQKEVFVVLGPNGAGKTTLLRALLQFIPFTGHITWMTDAIGYVPPQEFLQRKQLPPLSIEEFFAFKGVARAKILDELEAVGLPAQVLTKQFNTLSTGQFQRMLIAWALVNEPKVLLFDEPTSGIDIGGEETIYSLLHKLWKEKGLTIILVTHDLSIVWEHANTVLCLNKKFSCMGAPQKILTPEKLRELYGTNIKFYLHEHA